MSMPEGTTMSLGDDQLGRLALIEAIRANTDAVNRLARHGDEQDKKLDNITIALAEINTRLTLLERDTLKEEVRQDRQDIKDCQERLKVLEDEKMQRKGVLNLADWVFRNWPGIIGFVGLIIIVLVATGKLHV